MKTIIPLVASLALGATAQGVVTITNLDVRSNGAFVLNLSDITSYTINGAAPAGTVASDPLNLEITHANLDVDGDGSANDTVSFVIRVEGTGSRVFGQGVDAGFGNLDGLNISIIGVSGTTADSGNSIVFDGFTGITIGSGSGGAIDVGVDVNGTPLTIASADMGAFQFQTTSSDFAPTPTLAFTNSNATGASLVARAYDIQFSAVPEPSSTLLLGLAGSFFAFRRRK